ncbi:acyloxyacyl hydrolase [Litchfieldella qijiaojingensis]|uniref:acyloxyacyl hydrolase n=1 Tax=Litchfieldella qijiaojingensis TaxID=980347 RepID=UPI0016760F15|nr:acyloxyacyl hydrolase [Halomonas qijiaojingensis]
MKSLMKRSWPGFYLLALAIFPTLCVADSAGSEDGARISLGHTLIQSSVPMVELGYEYRSWEVAFSYLDRGHTSNGRQRSSVRIYSASRLFRPGWNFLRGQNYYRLGLSYVDDSPLVGGFNFRLGVGLDYGRFSIEYFHYSSAMINDVNSGIDGLQLRFKLSR